MNREAIVQAARSYIDVPFMHQGRSRHGIDCAGLLTCVAYDLEIKDVRVTDYGRLPDPDRARSIIEAHMDPVPFAQLQPGDVLSFVIVQDVQHYGLVVSMEPVRFVHAYQTVGKVVEQSMFGPWLRRLRRCYRFRDL